MCSIMLFAVFFQAGQSTIDHPQITVAFIAAAAVILSAVLQGWFFASRLERVRAEYSIGLESYKAELLKQLDDDRNKLAKQIEEARLEHQKHLSEYNKGLEERFSLKNKRMELLTQLRNAASIAKSGAKELVSTARFKQTEHAAIMGRVEDACRKISAFFEELRKAEVNAVLTRSDVMPVTDLGIKIMDVFSALDFDEGGKPEYAEKLDKQYLQVEEVFDKLTEITVTEGAVRVA